ncbi:group II intron reverse transcriptase/maturase [Microcoleus vaginatus PCC 9802]|uniref:group II intron reverse transcriptase/maturase n=1 Tax=Microcoleus vaginatus TaxID=119532 RepID=UPI00020D1142|nr:RNA-directed DNA polymerase (Reverse transcriptase) [Microcoleus vaginatus FGP-2]UNU17582.1 group II intron reverse transcriptase/maturase [Microcoleus vaginatus PCC 9802]
MSKTRSQPMVEWRHINWRKLERSVYKLQKRIYRASQRGDVKAIRRLQKTLMKSWSARCLAVRRVTQDNSGKKTAGVDGLKSLTPKQRLALVAKLKLSPKVAPTRRVWIPKPGTEEKRPLGIPTINDRALQALVKLALEPEWEARFEPNSYGFRAGRSCHDAIEQIFTVISRKAKYVLDADIAKCFDRIDHEALLKKLNTFPTIRRQVRAWLKAGVMDGKQLFPTSEGTPQGGVISPLLANIALHGMENRIAQAFPKRKVYKEGKYAGFISAAHLIRYADDFVILHEDITVVQRCKEIISEWLKSMGLELKPSKTRLAHTLEEYEGNTPGFNFLGFNIRQFPVGKYHSGKNNGKLLGFKTIITPSQEKQKIHYEQVANIIYAHRTATQEALIGKLNPIIRGWANYYSTVVSSDAYETQDHLIFCKLKAWAKRRHPKKSIQWIINRYWKTIGGNNWVFATNAKSENLMRLRTHSETPIVRHVKVKGESSPYDGNLVYWSTRRGKHPEISTKEATLMKSQRGKCNHCGLIFGVEDKWEIDHKIPRSKGGRDEYTNLQLLHKHCHDVKTAKDGLAGGSIDSYPSH